MITENFDVKEIPEDLRDIHSMAVTAVLLTSKKISTEIVERLHLGHDRSGAVFASMIINIACGAVVTAVELREEEIIKATIDMFEETLRLFVAHKYKEFKQ